MTAPLLAVQIPSIYESGGQRMPLPKRMALATPDMKLALFRIGQEVRAAGGVFQLSDLYRSYDMQLQAHLDFVSQKKSAFSPAPGASMHEAGRAFDVDVAALKMPLAAFWKVAERHLVVPIIAEPKAGVSESWHFECRGSHQLVYNHYKAERGNNFAGPAAAMAASAIVATGVRVDKFGVNAVGAQIQSALIRLGKNIGNLDGGIGPRSRGALEALQLGGLEPAEQLARLDLLLQEAFPDEYFDRVPESPLHD
jgi:hypothetical protein